MKLLYSVLALLVPFSSVYAQGEFVWATKMGGPLPTVTGFEERSGSLFCSGSFSGTGLVGNETLNSTDGAFFGLSYSKDDGQLLNTTQTPLMGFRVSDDRIFQLERINSNEYAMRLVDLSGNSIWGVSILVSGNGNLKAHDVAADHLGNLYIQIAADVNAMQMGGEHFSNIPLKGVFLWRLNADGSHAWIKRLGLSGYRPCGLEIMNNDEPVYVQSYNTEINVFRLTANGTTLWQKSITASTTPLDCIDVAVAKSGCFYVGGVFRQQLMFPNGVVLTSQGGGDAFLVRYDGSGTVNWARSFGSMQDDYLRDFATDDEGNVYCVGSYTNSIDFNGLILDDGFPNAFTTPAFMVGYSTVGKPFMVASVKSQLASNNQSIFTHIRIIDNFAYVCGRAFGPTQIGSNLLGEGPQTEFYPFITKYALGKQSVGTVNTNKPNDEMQVYPNPSNGCFTVSFSGITNTSDCTYTIFDVNGRMTAQQFGNPVFRNTSLQSGLYTLEVRDAAGNRFTKRIAVENGFKN